MLVKPSPTTDNDRVVEQDQLERLVLDAIDDRSTFDDRAFSALALRIHAFQRRWNVPYANYCRELGQKPPDDWRDIPAVPQSVFKHFALRTFPEHETTRTFRTSGTTGEGYGSHHFRSLALYEASILAGWRFFDLPAGLPQIVLTPNPADSPHSSLAHMMGTLGGLAPANGQTFHLRLDGRLDLDGIIARVETARRANHPLLLLGTALAFLHLCESLQTPLELPVGTRAMETGGYKGTGRTLAKDELYAMFGQALGLPADAVINEYGMTELSTPFYTRGLGRPHAGPPWARALVIDAETGREVAEGETGVVRLFDLANVGSVLAIQTQDLAVRRAEGQFELLGRDPAALPRGCSRAADEMLSRAAH